MSEINLELHDSIRTATETQSESQSETAQSESSSSPTVRGSSLSDTDFQPPTRRRSLQNPASWYDNVADSSSLGSSTTHVAPLQTDIGGRPILSDEHRSAEPLPLKDPPSSLGQEVVSDAGHSSVWNDRGHSAALAQDDGVIDQQLSPVLAQEDLLAGAGGAGLYLLQTDAIGTLSFDQDSAVTLQRSLRSALIQYRPGRKFLPIDQLNKIINPISVQHVLRSKFPSLPAAKLDYYTTEICEKREYYDHAAKNKKWTIRKRLFATLVFIEKVDKILAFIDRGVFDSDLPFKLIKTNNDNFEVQTGSKPLRILECFRHWTPFFLEAFEKWQWLMLSPFFSRADCATTAFDRVVHLPLEAEIILPFIQEMTREAIGAAGGHSDVRKVIIHPAHHKLSPVGDTPFALKELHSQRKKDFDREVEALKVISPKRHPFLIELLVTFQHDNSYFLLFPWADGGNLADFWKRMPSPNQSKGLALWIAEQCHGIATGLNFIHNMAITGSGRDALKPTPKRPYGRHGDIKPENVLLFLDKENKDGLGTLKISDFGLSRFHSRKMSKHTPASNVLHTATYRAPECDVKGYMTDKYDIWALGCLYLEFVTWYLLGWEAVEKDFVDQRLAEEEPKTEIPEDTFFKIVKLDPVGGYGARIKLAVIRWIGHLHDQPNCSRFIHDFLAFIEDKLLLVQPSERASSADVVSTIKIFKENCTDAAYCVDPFPRPPRQRRTIEEELVATPIRLSLAKLAELENIDVPVHQGETLEAESTNREASTPGGDTEEEDNLPSQVSEADLSAPQALPPTEYLPGPVPMILVSGEGATVSDPVISPTDGTDDWRGTRPSTNCDSAVKDQPTMATSTEDAASGDGELQSSKHKDCSTIITGENQTNPARTLDDRLAMHELDKADFMPGSLAARGQIPDSDANGAEGDDASAKNQTIYTDVSDSSNLWFVVIAMALAVLYLSSSKARFIGTR